MSARNIALRILLVVVTLSLLAVFMWFLWGTGMIPPVIPINVVYTILAITGVVLVVYSISSTILKALLPKYGRKAYAVTNTLKIFTYIIAGIILLASLGISPEVALAGGTFSGLIVGLALQPVLSNFFAGLIVLLTGYVKPGDDIRLITSEMPYQWAFLPGYKYFSPDYVFVGYRGRIIEVGLLYSLMISDSGVELKIPNRIIFDAAVVNYTPEHQLERILQVRYEFKVDYDPDLVLERIKNALNDVKEIEEIMINEQSDKEYYIVQIRFSTPGDKDWKELKSDILKRLVKVHRELRLAEKSVNG
ncbi:MAG: mechanosensitive ion channel family protein [Nitrososphaerota archaeon]